MGSKSFVQTFVLAPILFHDHSFIDTYPLLLTFLFATPKQFFPLLIIEFHFLLVFENLLGGELEDVGIREPVLAHLP